MELDFGSSPVRYFVAVAEEGEITRAAGRLDPVQPETLSHAVSELETEIGVKLLVRHAEGVTLTPEGELFLAKARVAIAAYDEAALTARRLGRAARGELEVGFVGPPPPVLAPELFGAFAEAHSEAQLSFTDLQFPHSSTTSWLDGVDIGLCFSPTADPGVHLQSIREEPRVVVAARSHRLSAGRELGVDEVSDETFVGFDDAIERGWAGWLTLDDHRGEAPARVTDTVAGNALEMLTLVAAGQGIVVLASSHGDIIAGALPNLAVIPLADARPTQLTLAWRTDNQHPLVDSLAMLARDLS